MESSSYRKNKTSRMSRGTDHRRQSRPPAIMTSSGLPKISFDEKVFRINRLRCALTISTVSRYLSEHQHEIPREFSLLITTTNSFLILMYIQKFSSDFQVLFPNIEQIKSFIFGNKIFHSFATIFRNDIIKFFLKRSSETTFRISEIKFG